MNDTRNHRFWQIHLSTAIVASFAAGMLLWSNLTAILYNPCNEFFDSIKYGWPDDIYWVVRDGPDSEWEGFGPDWRAVLFNAAFDASLLATMVIAAECLIRRRDSRR